MTLNPINTVIRHQQLYSNIKDADISQYGSLKYNDVGWYTYQHRLYQSYGYITYADTKNSQYRSLK